MMAQKIKIQDGRVVYTSTDPSVVDVNFTIEGTLDGTKNITVAGYSVPVTSITTLNFDSAATVTALDLPADTTVLTVEVIVDTTFDGAPTLSVGTSGDNSRYATTVDINLLDTPESSSLVYSGKTPNVLAETVNLYYTSGGATVGSARVVITHVRTNT